MRKIKLLFSLILISNACFASIFYVDPINGNSSGDGSLASPWQTLEQVINDNLIESRSYITPYDPLTAETIIKNSGAPIKAGDTIMLYSGMHGELLLYNYINSDFITIKAVLDNNPMIERIHFQAGKNWRLDGLTISSEPYGNYINNKLIYLETHDWQGPVDHIEIIDCDIFSSETPWTIAEEWVLKASDGIYIKADSITISNNLIRNIRMGISMVGDHLQVIGNRIINFSGDGIRLLGSNNIIESNIIKNCYSVDANHDDGIQSFTSGGLTVDNNTISRNTIINYEDPNQALLGSLQGIGCFDGFFNNWIVENNLIIVDHWHGISFYGANNCQIINNTVLDPSPNTTPGPAWIKIEDFNNTASSDCIIKNNVSNDLSINPNSNSEIGNNTLLTSYTDYNIHFVDYANADFHLKENSYLIDNAELAASPPIDLDGVIRPQGPTSDIGAYEYESSLIINTYSNQSSINIFPNPSINVVTIDGQMSNITINLFNLTGKLIRKYPKKNLPFLMELNTLEKGIYFIRITSNTAEQEIYTSRIIKL